MVTSKGRPLFRPRCVSRHVRLVATRASRAVTPSMSFSSARRVATKAPSPRDAWPDQCKSEWYGHQIRMVARPRFKAVPAKVSRNIGLRVLVVPYFSELNSVQPLTFLSENVVVTLTRVRIPLGPPHTFRGFLRDSLQIHRQS